MADMGMDAYRFSIAWARILPNGTGQVNQAGIDHYNKLIDALLDKGIQPYVTLYHWDLPQNLQDQYGGWLDRKIVDDFVVFAETCFKAFGNRVKQWITVNEPRNVAVHGYDTGLQAPGRCSGLRHLSCGGGHSSTEPYIVAHHFILAHATIAKIYRNKYKASQNGILGMAFDVVWFEPLANTWMDIDAAERTQEFQLGWLADPFFFGDYPASMRKKIGKRLPRFTAAEAALVKGSMDFIGINHYTTYYTSHIDINIIHRLFPDTSTDVGTFSQGFTNGTAIGDRAHSLWLFIVPRGMRSVANYVKDRYNNPPVYITENGMDDSNNPLVPLKQALKDTKRIKYHNDYLTNLAAAIKEDGCDVRGYFAWSLMDNWEWAAGYTSRFGLYFVDYKDGLKRYPKDSVQWFKNLLGSS
uniref:Uncharacterized protein n=1 Tax=Avena sativa TaxID=4498 RepID=A0ACD5VKG1_AVESA